MTARTAWTIAGPPRFIAALAVTAIVGAAVVLGSPAWAGGLPAAFVCQFSTGFFSVREDGRFATSRTRDTLSITYASIDQASGTAQMVANAGASEVMLLVGREAVHFAEVTAAGNMTLTTVYTTADRDGRFFASHSRHIASDTGPMVSQYLGSCAARWP